MSLFPYNVWRKLLKEVMMNDNSELFQKGENQGDLGLRRAIMYYLRQSRGVHVGTSQIVIGAGIENLLFLLSQTLGKGRIMAIGKSGIFKRLSDGPGTWISGTSHKHG